MCSESDRAMNLTNPGVIHHNATARRVYTQACRDEARHIADVNFAAMQLEGWRVVDGAGGFVLEVVRNKRLLEIGDAIAAAVNDFEITLDNFE